MDVAEGDPELKCWPFDEAYANTYLVRGGTHRAQVFEFGTCQRAAVRNLNIVEWHNIERFAPARKDWYCHHATVPTFWQKLETHLIVCGSSLPAPPPPTLAYQATA